MGTKKIPKSKENEFQPDTEVTAGRGNITQSSIISYLYKTVNSMFLEPIGSGWELDSISRWGQSTLVFEKKKKNQC